MSLKNIGLLIITFFFSAICMASDWEGTYVFQEKTSSGTYQYDLIIFEHEVRFTAEFIVKSSEENYSYDCEVKFLSDEKLEIVVEKAHKGTLKRGDILLQLTKENTKILTDWGSFNTKKTLESHKEYFRLDQSRIDYMRKYKNQLPYEVEFFRNKWIQKHMKLALGNKYDGMLTFLQIESAIKLNNNVLYVEGIRADMEGGGNAGKNIIVIDLNNKIIYVTSIDGHQKMSHFRSGNGPKPKVLTNWINKHN